jgi:hypothetical protein
MKDTKVWNECFDAVEKGLRAEPIYHMDRTNLEGKVFLKELYDKAGIDFEDGLDTLVDLIAYIIDTNGYTIQKKNS